jgi:hypothetical protein
MKTAKKQCICSHITEKNKQTIRQTKRFSLAGQKRIACPVSGSQDSRLFSAPNIFFKKVLNSIFIAQRLLNICGIDLSTLESLPDFSFFPNEYSVKRSALILSFSFAVFLPYLVGRIKEYTA